MLFRKQMRERGNPSRLFSSLSGGCRPFSPSFSKRCLLSLRIESNRLGVIASFDFIIFLHSKIFKVVEHLLILFYDEVNKDCMQRSERVCRLPTFVALNAVKASDIIDLKIRLLGSCEFINRQRRLPIFFDVNIFLHSAFDS